MAKNISVLFGILLLSGCALIPDRFDNVEYMQLVNLNLVASEKSCTIEDIVALKYYSRFLAKYSAGTLNTNVSSIYSDINSNVEELAARENPSTAYCLAKKEIIAEQTEMAISTFGKRIKQ
jgi:hypothetical protein